MVWWVAPSSPRVIPAWDVPGDCEPCGCSDHVGLCDAALEIPVGECLGEVSHLEGALQVSSQGYNPAVLLSCLEEAGSETTASVNFACVDVFFHFDVSSLVKNHPKSRPAASWPPRTAPRSEPFHAMRMYLP